MNDPFIIAPETGRVRFPDLKLELRPLMPEKEFIVATAPFNRDTLGDASDGWQRYSLHQVAGDRKFGMFFIFIKGHLSRASFAYAPKDETWDNWTEEAEQQRVKEFEQLLTEQLGGKRSFTWGNVAILADNKSGGTNIWVNYSDQSQA